MDKNTHTGHRLCGVCSGNIGQNDTAVLCDACNLWFHTACGKVNKRVYSRIHLAPVNKPVEWLCSACKYIKQNGRKPRAKKCDLNDTCTSSPNQSLTDNIEITPELNPQKTGNLNVGMSTSKLEYDKIVLLPMEDIDDLKAQIKLLKKEKENLSDIVAKKMEVIYKMETTIHDLIKHGTPIPTLPVPNTANTELYGLPKASTNSSNSIGSPDLNLKKQRVHINQDQRLTNKNDTNATETSAEKTNQVYTNKTHAALIIGDSLLHGLGPVLQNKDVSILIKPGAKIKDISRYISDKETLPPKVILNIGSNNASLAKTPNHLMRPLWLTIEAGIKYFKNTKWFVNSIPYRRDVRDNYISDINDSLQFMCEQLGAHFIKLNQTITNDCYLGDGIHLNNKGINLLANKMIEEADLPDRTNPRENKTERDISKDPLTQNQEIGAPTRPIDLDGPEIEKDTELKNQDKDTDNKEPTLTGSKSQPKPTPASMKKDINFQSNLNNLRI